MNGFCQTHAPFYRTRNGGSEVRDSSQVSDSERKRRPFLQNYFFWLQTPRRFQGSPVRTCYGMGTRSPECETDSRKVARWTGPSTKRIFPQPEVASSAPICIMGRHCLGEHGKPSLPASAGSRKRGNLSRCLATSPDQLVCPCLLQMFSDGCQDFPPTIGTIGQITIGKRNVFNQSLFVDPCTTVMEGCPDTQSPDGNGAVRRLTSQPKFLVLNIINV